ncbi:LytR family transcriptional regulator [bacterium]|nr:MAG: LytR family transcriptional regulator [bacterium]
MNEERPYWKRFLGSIAYILFLGSALVFGTAAGWMGKSSTMTTLIKRSIVQRDPEEVFGGKKSLTLLLMGCDEDRYWSGYNRSGRKIAEPIMANGSNVKRKYARADMILVARLDFEKNTITGLSIPRDTSCELPGYRNQKINAYNVVAVEEPTGHQIAISEQDGPQWMRQAVEHTLPGVSIDKVVVMNYDAFKEMVDVVGGVTVDVEKRMDYDDKAGNVHIHFKPGRQKLDGYDSMMYVRFRKSDSDFKRQERQKEFLVSFKQAVISDPLKLPQVFEKAAATMNGALNDEEIAALAMFARSVKPTDIKMGQIPVFDQRGTTNLKVDQDKLTETMEKFGLLPSVVGAGV